MEPLFVVAKTIGSPGRNIAYFFIQHCLCEHDHCNILGVIMTMIVLLLLATHE